MMHIINTLINYNDCIDPTIMYLIGLIHEYKGKTSLYNLNTKTLNSLSFNSIINSTVYSNEIEGIKTTKDKVIALINGMDVINNKTDQEVAGYKDILHIINDNYDNMIINSNTILYLHKELYKYTNSAIGGKYKSSDNYIEEVINGVKQVRFTPAPAFITPDLMDDLFRSYNEAINNNNEPLLVIPVVILDFLSIHPFNDGNGRISRLLTNLLLFKSGYNISKYISIEEEISNTKNGYYDTLKESSNGWHDNTNDYKPFIKYYLNTILSAYIQLDMIASYSNHKIIDKVEYIIMNSVVPIGKKEIMNKVLDASKISIERSLNKLLNTGVIEKVGNGSATKYVIKRK